MDQPFGDGHTVPDGTDGTVGVKQRNIASGKLT